MFPHVLTAALACACSLNNPTAGHPRVLQVAAAANQLELSGFHLGMTPQEAAAAAKATGRKFWVHQAPKPGGGAYPVSVVIDGPNSVTIQFSAVTQTVDLVDIEAPARMPGSGDDALYKAAEAKWGHWNGSDGAVGLSDLPDIVWWDDRDKPHVEYSTSKWDRGVPSTVTLKDPAAMKASEAFLRGDPVDQAPKL